MNHSDASARGVNGGEGKDKVLNRTERSIISTSSSFSRNAQKSRDIKGHCARSSFALSSRARLVSASKYRCYRCYRFQIRELASGCVDRALQRSPRSPRFIGSRSLWRESRDVRRPRALGLGCRSHRIQSSNVSLNNFHICCISRSF